MFNGESRDTAPSQLCSRSLLAFYLRFSSLFRSADGRPAASYSSTALHCLLAWISLGGNGSVSDHVATSREGAVELGSKLS